MEYKITNIKFCILHYISHLFYTFFFYNKNFDKNSERKNLYTYLITKINSIKYIYIYI